MLLLKLFQSASVSSFKLPTAATKSLLAPVVLSTSCRFLSTPAAKKDEDEEDAVSPVTAQREKMYYQGNRHMVWGPHVSDNTYMPTPILPKNPSEIATLDPAETVYHRTNMDGTVRTVVIRQDKKSARQAPLNPEKVWRIHHYEDGKITEKWSNTLMTWTSNADPYQTNPPLTFRNAADAVYFAQKRGWQYIVKPPIRRKARFDDAQYQDNFLPQHVAAQVLSEGTACSHWSRPASGASHYFRPLPYRKDTTAGPSAAAVVRQHGAVRDHEAFGTMPHVEGYYKRR
jgi:ETC complex I subunit conserved region